MRHQTIMVALLATVSAITHSTGSHAAGGDKAFGEYLSGECVTCHQLSGQHTAGVPPIVGLPEDMFIALMNAYRSKERPNAVMQTIAAKFKDDEIAALAAYFGGLKPK